jgi:hypothetical protein
MSEETPEVKETTEKKRSGISLFKVLAFLLIITAVGFGGYMLIGKMGGEAVAVVNGQKILLSEYTERYNQLASSVTAQGLNATSTEMQTALKKQTLDNLVNEALVLQAAEKQGIKVKETEVDTRISDTKAQVGEAYDSVLKAQGYTEESFRDFVEKGNIVQQYLGTQIDVSSAVASDEEIEALYNQAKLANKDLPSLSEVRAQVEAQIVQEKQQKLVADYIAKLKSESQVEILLQ